MPRQARLDAPGTLHHIIIRGIERRKIVDDREDRENFVERLGNAASETGTPWKTKPSRSLRPGRFSPAKLVAAPCSAAWLESKLYTHISTLTLLGAKKRTNRAVAIRAISSRTRHLLFTVGVNNFSLRLTTNTFRCSPVRTFWCVTILGVRSWAIILHH